MVQTKIVIKNKVGLHARPVSLFVQTANKFASAIKVQNLTTSSRIVDAKSIIGILSLGVMQNHEILLEAEGTDAADALQAIQTLIDTNFGEK